MKNKFLLITIFIMIIAISSKAQVTGTLTDSRDGKVYKTVKIGTQTWMAENLAYQDYYKLGKAYGADQSTVATYGYLYTSGAVSCPTGWHIPSVDEWNTMITYLGDETIAGDKLKAKTSWSKQNTSTTATNSSGFSALPGGEFYFDDDDYLKYSGIGLSGAWWTTTEAYFFDERWVFSLSYNFQKSIRKPHLWMMATQYVV